MDTGTCMPAAVFLGILLIIAQPATALEVRHIDISVSANGDAFITADYRMNLVEQLAVYPAALPLIAANSGKKVVIHSVSPQGIVLTAPYLVNVRHIANATLYRTPSCSITDLQRELDKFWFGDLVNLDVTSGSVRITFPDGKIINYTDLTHIPSFEHAVAAS